MNEFIAKLEWWNFYCNTSGIYRVNAKAVHRSGADGNQVYLEVWKNTSALADTPTFNVNLIWQINATNNGNGSGGAILGTVEVDCLIKLSAGQYFAIYAVNQNANNSVINGMNENQVCISRVE